MNNKIAGLVTILLVLLVASCTTNRTGYTYDKWIYIETYDDVILEKMNTASYQTGFFSKELLGVYDVTYRIRNNRGKQICIVFDVKDKRNVSFSGHFKKGKLVQAGETVRVGRVYMKDGSRSWTTSIQVDSSYKCEK